MRTGMYITASRNFPVIDYFYSIHGVTVRLTTHSSAIASAVQTLLGGFRSPTVNSGFLELHFSEIPDPASPLPVPPLHTQVFSSNGSSAGDASSSVLGYKVYRDVYERPVIIFAALGYLLIDYPRGRVEGRFNNLEAINPEILTSVCHIALIELLKLEGLYTLHAAALEKGGLGLLVPGHSGEGKTTCCISLLRAGYRCLSDDHPLIRARGTDLELLPFPAKICVTEKTIEFFPELRDGRQYLYKGAPKQYFYLEDIFPHAGAEPCAPALILFPQIVDGRTRTELLPKAKAFTELLPHTVFAADRDVTKRQFELLSQLVARAECYRLYCGRDIIDLPQLVESVFESL
jgi:hypothetical protein